MKDLYRILGVPEGADEAAIKATYRRLAKELHPDATGGDKKKTERFKEVNEAYAILGDRQKRSEYDRMRQAPVRPDGMPEGFDFEDFARTFGGRKARAGAGARVDFDINDLFGSLFGDATRSGGTRDPFGRGRPRVSRGQDLVGALEVSLSEAALGARRSVRSGAGAPIEVQIPPGVESGGRLRIPGKGGAAPEKGGAPGDLYLEISVRDDPHLRREGDDIHLELPVTIGEATLGAKVNVPTVDGPVSLTVPPGTSSGGRLRLRGRGVVRRDGTRGDQYCTVQIAAPRLQADDEESRRLVQELARRTAGQVVRNF